MVCSVSPGMASRPRGAYLRARIWLRRPLRGQSPEVRVSRAIRLSPGSRPLRNARLFASLENFDDAVAGTLDLQARMDLFEGGMIRDRHATGIRVEPRDELSRSLGDFQALMTSDPSGWCLVCGDRLRPEPVVCRRCHTPHHHECWDYAGGCATFACVANPGRG